MDGFIAETHLVVQPQHNHPDDRWSSYTRRTAVGMIGTAPVRDRWLLGRCASASFDEVTDEEPR